MIVYLDHPFNNVLGFKEGIVVNDLIEIGTGKTKASPEIISLQQEFMRFWKDKGISVEYINVGEYEKIKSLKNKFSEFRTFSVPWNLEKFLQYKRVLNVSYFNSKENMAQIHKAVTSCMSKAFMNELLKKDLPEIMPETSLIIKKENLKKTILPFLKNPNKTYVIKSEYSNGGYGSSILKNENDFLNYLANFSKSPFQSCENTDKVTEFIFEEYIFASSQPSIFMEITDENIKIISKIHERETKNLKYESSLSLSKTKHANSIIKYAKLISEKMHKIGYRGVCDIEFIESDKLYFCEVNARYPISYYPYNFDIDRTVPFKQKKFFSKRKISYDFLKKELGDFFVDSQGKGISLLGVPDFSNPLHNITILFSGYSDYSKLEQIITEKFC